jgi:hypothetical protein
MAPSTGKKMMSECGEARRGVRPRAVEEHRLVSREVLRFPVVSAALRLGGVQETLLGQVRPPLDHVAHRPPQPLERRQEPLALGDVTGVTDEHCDDVLPVRLPWQPGHGRCPAHSRGESELGRRLLGKRAECLERARRLLGAPRNRSAQDLGTHRARRYVNPVTTPKLPPLRAAPRTGRDARSRLL